MLDKLINESNSTHQGNEEKKGSEHLTSSSAHQVRPYVSD